MFYFTRLLTRSSQAALASAAFFTTAIPILLFGDAVLTDMAGYFFILLGMYLVVRWDIRHASLSRVLLAALVVAVGILSKESVASVLLFGLVWVLLSKPSWGSAGRITLFTIIGIGISLLWSIAVGISYLEWYNQGGLIYASTYNQLGLRFRLRMLIVSIQYGFGKYGEVIVPAILGFLRIERKGHFTIQTSILLSTLAIILAWPIIDTRFTFILFPAIFSLAGLGLENAYNIIFRSRLISDVIWPSFKPSARSLAIFSLLVVAVYVLITNVVLIRYISFPWNPLTDPSVSPIDLR
jgi:4-amino-4-deoxy-L-arabinose transferase-like glycosyltransferase